ncbi:hypothetical protein AX13_11990 [Comamonas aquatica DA1877]|uniref:Uncharacterized protein n=1 Tax=Comamonas aquatica DA1877 TaxID=1457173 RepID=A0A014MKG9_9BURK|nr:hypothetical protein AX13_11990 [Comamonas aquatica DA1877]
MLALKTFCVFIKLMVEHLSMVKNAIFLSGFTLFV